MTSQFNRFLIVAIAVIAALLAILAGATITRAQGIECPEANMRVELLKEVSKPNKAKCVYSNGIGDLFPVADFCIGNAPANTITTKAVVTSAGHIKCVWKTGASAGVPDGFRRPN